RQNVSMTPRTIVAVLAAASIGIAACSRQKPPESPDNRPAAAAQAAPELVSRVRDGRRVIFIGLDGADWSLLDQYVKDGTMPTLARLVREGTSGTATTLHPPLSPLVWTSMLTGARSTAASSTSCA